MGLEAADIDDELAKRAYRRWAQGARDEQPEEGAIRPPDDVSDDDLFDETRVDAGPVDEDGVGEDIPEDFQEG